MLSETSPPLSAEESSRLIEFARACKAAARAVLLYPDGHPAIGATLGRIVRLTSAETMPAPLELTVAGDTVKVQSRRAAREDAALAELAEMLHNHLVGALVVHPGGDVEAWRSFLLLLGRSADEVRAEGGIARLWTTLAGRHIQLREIDYGVVLRERPGTGTAGWADVIEHCLQGEDGRLSEDARRLLLDVGGDAEKLTALIASVDAEALGADGAAASRAAALVRLLDRIVTVVSDEAPDRVGPVLDNLATTLGGLSPDLMADMLTETGMITETPDLVHTVVSHMSDSTIAAFVGRHALVPGTPVERLATAFQTLVPEDRRERLLSLARDEAAAVHGAPSSFDALWEHVAQKLMVSYTDEAYVSAQYGRELSSAKTVALAVEHLSDDPPERLAAWLRTVSATELRRLDLALVHDLLRIERDPERWATLMRPVVSLIEDLLLVGDFEPADELIGTLTGHKVGGGPLRQAAAGAIDALVGGSLLHHTASHLATVDDATFDRVKAMFLSLGDALVRPLAEALLEEAPPRVRERLSSILIAFGPSGRSEVERLKTSANPSVRRTAIQLLRAFGGDQALPELTGLLADRDPQVQREAVRAILGVGSDAACRALTAALVAADPARREALFGAIASAREVGAAVALAYLLDHLDHRGPLADLYLRTLHALGTPHLAEAAEGVEALGRALERGEWWAPRRTAALRDAAAAALARIGTPDALAALDHAIAHGGRGVRRAAGAHRPPATLPGREAA